MKFSKLVRQINKDFRKKHPKSWKRIEDAVNRDWEMKMMTPVLDFVFDLGKQIYIRPKKDKALYNGPEIEQEVWKLLRKVRRITQLEKQNQK